MKFKIEKPNILLFQLFNLFIKMFYTYQYLWICISQNFNNYLNQKYFKCFKNHSKTMIQFINKQKQLHKLYLYFLTIKVNNKN